MNVTPGALRPFPSGLPHRRGRTGRRRLPAASLAAGAPTTVQTGKTSMAGLNCGTPSYLAWPDLERGLAGAVAIDDAAATDAIADLTALGVDSGPCGAASLAALRVLATEPARSRLGLCPDSSVVLLNTEGSDAAG